MKARGTNAKQDQFQLPGPKDIVKVGPRHHYHDHLVQLFIIHAGVHYGRIYGRGKGGGME